MVGPCNSSSFSQTLCSICYEDLKPIVEDLQSISICGHVFHELCLQQWFEYCPKGKKTCPFCKQKCTASNVSRLYFQSVGDSNDPKLSQKLQSSIHDPEELKLEYNRLKGKVDGLNTALESRENDLEKTKSELGKCKEQLKKEAAAKNEALQQTQTINHLLNIKTEQLKKEAAAKNEALQQTQTINHYLLNIKTQECFLLSRELNKSDMKCIKLQERSMALAKELAALKLVSDLNLDEDEIVKLASLGTEAHSKESVDVLKKSLVIRNKTYKDLIAKYSTLARDEARSRAELEKTKEKLEKFKTRIQKTETTNEEKDNEVLRALKALKKRKLSSSVVNEVDPTHTPQDTLKEPDVLPPSGGRHRGGGRGRDSLAGTSIKIRLGPWKGYKGRVVDASGTTVRIELESQMKVVTVDRTHFSYIVNATTTPYRDTHRYGSGSETPMHPSRTPLHPYMTPMRDSGATPIHDGMRTPMRDRAWNPYTPMSPPRDSWEDGNPSSWGSTPQYQPGSPRSRAYEAPTPGSGWANTPGGSYKEAGTPRDNTSAYGGSYKEAGTPRDNTSAYANAPSPYLPSTPGGQPPMTPSSAFLPGTPGGQPMTPGGVDLDIMSPIAGGDNDGPWYLPDILVNVRRSGDDAALGVIREVLLDGACRVALGASGNGEIITASPNEIEVVPPKKSDKIKIIGGAQRGATGKLIGVDGTDGIVMKDVDVTILDMAILAKLSHLT